ncbi:MAG: O-antigen ligase family protein [Candidatus Polarisedimenticolia bacterium]
MSVIIVSTDLTHVPKTWALSVLLLLAAIGTWTAAFRQMLTLRFLDTIAWAVLIAHTVFVSRVRDPHELLTEGLSPQILTEIVIWVLLFGYALARLVHSPEAFTRLWGPTTKYATLFLVLALCSAAYAASPTVTLAWSFKLAVILLLASVFFAKSGGVDVIASFLVASHAGLVLMLVQFILMGLISPEDVLRRSDVTNITRLGGYFLSANQLASVAGMLTLLYMINILCKRASWTTYLGMLISSFLLFGSLGRGGIAATLLVALLLLKYLGRIRFAFWVCGFLLLILVSFPQLATVSWELITRRQSEAELLSFTGRTQIWEHAIYLISQKPLLGWGYVSGSRTGFLSLAGMWSATHSHNVLLEVLVNLGLLGALTLITLVTKTSQYIIRSVRLGVLRPIPPPATILHLKLFALLAFLVCDGFFTSSFAGAPRFETVLLIGLSFCADHIIQNQGQRLTATDTHHTSLSARE